MLYIQGYIYLEVLIDNQEVKGLLQELNSLLTEYSFDCIFLKDHALDSFVFCQDPFHPFLKPEQYFCVPENAKLAQMMFGLLVNFGLMIFQGDLDLAFEDNVDVSV